jgi:hypothetical protein
MLPGEDAANLQTAEAAQLLEQQLQAAPQRSRRNPDSQQMSATARLARYGELAEHLPTSKLCGPKDKASTMQRRSLQGIDSRGKVEGAPADVILACTACAAWHGPWPLPCGVTSRGGQRQLQHSKEQRHEKHVDAAVQLARAASVIAFCHRALS